MKAKMKYLNYVLLGLLSGAVGSASASFGDVDCREGIACEFNEDDLFLVKSKSTGEGGSSVGGNVIQLSGNGMIWASEDLNLGTAELSISAPSYIGYAGNNKLTKPVEFYIKSNYSAFVERFTVTIYRGSNADLNNPIVEIPVAPGAMTTVTWDGDLGGKYQFKQGDILTYVLKAYDDKGNFDETYSKTIELVSPAREENGNVELRDDFIKKTGQLTSTDEAVQESLLQDVAKSNDIKKQNIPFVGSRITIQGANIPDGVSVTIDGESYPVDLDRKFSADFLLPLGKHQFNVEAGSTRGDINVDITGNSFFLVGIADFTAYQNKATGSGKNSALYNAEGEYDDSSMLYDGRLAFYSKAKFDGRYTITAHADTKNRDIKKLFSGFGKADPKDVFYDLDPDLFYPTYGDDSTVYRDVDTQGRFYLRVDWDKSQALWGNYNTGFTDTQFANYSRSLYGAALDWRSTESTSLGDAKTTVRMFGSQEQSAPGQDEFLGTGGSLYYLRQTNILSGSDKVSVEVRDPLTGLVMANVSLKRGVDYEINAIQGRIMLSRPLLQIVNQYASSIISNGPSSGYDQYLVVNYEYVPNGFDNDSVSGGVRAKHWVDDHFGVGGTYVKQKVNGAEYIIQGVDVTLKSGNGSYIKAEYTKTESTGGPIYFSNNGGLSFEQTNKSLNENSEGAARGIEGRVNFKDLGLQNADVVSSGWLRKIDAGFAGSANNLVTDERLEYGADTSIGINENVFVYLKHSNATQGESRYTESQLSTEFRLDESQTITTEYKRVQTKASKADEPITGQLVGVQYGYNYDSWLDMYIGGQLTVGDDGGAYEKNNAVNAGIAVQYGDNSTIGISGSKGSRGHDVTVTADHKVTDDYSVYASYNLAQSQSDYDRVFGSSDTGWTIGQRWRVTDRLNVYSETQQLKDGSSKGTGQTVGADYTFEDGWSAGLGYQDSRLKNAGAFESDDKTRRKAVSATLSRTTADMDWSSKLEYRRDSGAEKAYQWVTANRVNWKVNEGLRLSGKFNYSRSYDYVNESDSAEYREGAIGFAYRPHDNNRWAVFGRYTYLYDVASSGQQSSGYDQQSHIFSLEGVYKLNSEWEFAAKLAHRKSEKRFSVIGDDWFDSSATFAAVQARYDLVRGWHVMGEYRWLKVKDGGTKQGFLIGVDYDITDNLRFGIGYNFTDFSDNLANQDYKYKGFFINVVGYY